MADSPVNWVQELQARVEAKPMVVLRLNEEEWEQLRESRRGVGTFTIARPHGEFSGVKAPTVCLVIGATRAGPETYFALIGSRSTITTLQSRVGVKRGVRIEPANPYDWIGLLHTKSFQTALRERLDREDKLTVLSPKLSAELVAGLAVVDTNAGPMRAVAAGLSAPKCFRNNGALQADAIRTAMKTFGLGGDDRADSLDLFSDQNTGLARVPIMEDGVIEHDARSLPGYRLSASSITGRATFSRGMERLEIITANRRQLERAFGVDLIYLNLVRKNLVMLQYKMLEAPEHGETDWLFRPDGQLDSELARMRRFNFGYEDVIDEYRLNPAVFYLKFVKRDGSLRKSGIIMPVDHYDQFVESPAARGPRGGLRIGYDALSGCYMREEPFVDLIKSGYIGTYAKTTDDLMVLVDAVVERGGAVVAAMQSRQPSTSS